MSQLFLPVMQIGPAPGVKQNNVIAPGNLAIPTLANGNLPKYLLCVVTGIAGTGISVSPEVGANDGVESSGLMIPAASSVSQVISCWAVAFSSAVAVASSRA